MANTHPSSRTLELFLHGDLPDWETQAVVGHLLTDCPACQSVTGESWAELIDGLKAARTDFQDESPRESSAQADSPYRKALVQATSRAREEARSVERNRAFAKQLFKELLQHPPRRRLTLVRNSRRFQTPELCEILIEEGFDRRFTDVQVGVELSELAVVIGRQLDDQAAGPEETKDLLGRAWAYHGNALRVASELRRADTAFQEASRCFEEGRRDDLDRALWNRFTALLLRARRDFSGARARQEHAIRLYLRQGETRIAAQVMSDQGLGLLYEGKPESAIVRLEQALALAIPLADEREVAAVRHNLAFCLTEIGEHERALQQISGIRSAVEGTGDALSLVRLRWLEGRIFVAMDRDEQAEEALLEVRGAFEEEAIAYDVALVCLDLAMVYARQGRTSEVRQLAQGMLPIFESRDVHREAIAALVLFREAALAETATVALVEKVSQYLQVARHNPKLRFDPS